MRHQILLVSLAGAVIVAATSACAGASSGTESASPSPQASKSGSARPSASAGESRNVGFSVDLSQQYSKVSEAGSDGEVSYGYSQLDGYTKINGKSVRVRMQGLMEYNDGSGPLGGFLELRWSDGSTLAFRQNGAATTDAASKRTEYKADLVAIGGTKDLSGTTGTGTFTGSRKSGSSTSIRIAVDLNLQGAPAGLVGNVASAIPSTSYSATIEP